MTNLSIRPGDLMDIVDETDSQRSKDKVYCDEAGVTLISSDSVIFKVPRLYLEAVSPVFRSMIEHCDSNSSPVCLTDESIEHSSILRLLLDLACSKPFVAFDKEPKRDIIKLVKLAEKYDCVTPLTTLKLLVNQPKTAETSLNTRFLIACTLNLPEVAHRFFPGAAEWTWGGNQTPRPTIYNDIPGASVLDVTALSSETIDLFPREYFLCLLRASRLRMTNPPGEWQAVADDFLAQLRHIQPKSSSTTAPRSR